MKADNMQIQVHEFSKKVEQLLSELISVQCGGAFKEQFLTSLQVCRLKLPLLHYCFLVRLDKS